MNIKEAKEQIKNAMKAYFSKDETGEYEIPAHQQRPIFLMGAPGIGKTAIMEQVASEMGVGLLSYSMTHHTRQSALGLPFIVNKVYDGKEYSISEYTMSEIIASVYDLMETTGVKEGILFLDEINCVSETLAPIMLQFLQYKVFGRHTVPKGWIVVTAGNPPEYNNSVREFDIVTWDRLKRIDVEPDFGVWKEYALSAGVHPAVLTYLEIRGGDFYRIESTVDGKSFVTARGWEDLSRMIRVYEKNGITVDLRLVEQYVQNKKIARDFAQYYDLFNKYKSDYQVDRIMNGTADADITTRAKNAKFDERLSLIGLMMDAVNSGTRAVTDEHEVTVKIMDMLTTFRAKMERPDSVPAEVLGTIRDERRKELEAGKKASSMSETDQRRERLFLRAMDEQIRKLNGVSGRQQAMMILKKDYETRLADLKTDADRMKARLSNLFAFAEKAFEGGQEMLILVTEMTVSSDCAKFIGRYGCPEYFRHNKDLMLAERRMEILQVLDDLKLDWE